MFKGQRFAILAMFFVIVLGYFVDTLWILCGYFLNTFQIRLYTFQILLGYFWVTFGKLLGYFWDTFGIIFGILLGYLKQPKVHKKVLLWPESLKPKSWLHSGSYLLVLLYFYFQRRASNNHLAVVVKETCLVSCTFDSHISIIFQSN